MSKHPLRWSNLAFGLFFLAIVGNWALWERDLLTPREFSLTAAGVLIVVGLIGAAAALWPSPPTPTSPSIPTHEGAPHEEADPQP
jgi:hypothetical protein